MAGVYQHGNLTELLQYLNYSHRYPDAPQNFIPPALTDLNYVPPYHGEPVIYVASILTALATIVVVLRLIARKGKLGWDDCFAVLALCALIAFTATEIVVVRHGCVGHHVYDCSPAVLRYAFKYLSVLVKTLGLVLVRMSILFFVLRLTAATSRVMRRITILTMWFVVLSLIGVVFTMTFQCKPIRAAWDLTARIPGPFTCISISRGLMAWAIIFAITDFWLVILPSKLVWELQLPLRTRCGIIFIFCLGLAATISAAVKCKYIWVAYSTWDATWVFPTLLYSSHIELSLGLIACSLPALNTWFLRIVPSRFSRDKSLSQVSSSAIEEIKARFPGGWHRRYPQDKPNLETSHDPGYRTELTSAGYEGDIPQPLAHPSTQQQQFSKDAELRSQDEDLPPSFHSSWEFESHRSTTSIELVIQQPH